MEPYHFRYGNQAGTVLAAPLLPASMEPYHFRYGNYPMKNKTDRLYKLQWSHTISGMETGLTSSSPTVFHLRFNGAIPCQVWKPRQHG